MKDTNYTQELYNQFLFEAGVLDKFKNAIGVGNKPLTQAEATAINNKIDQMISYYAKSKGSTKEKLAADSTFM